LGYKGIRVETSDRKIAKPLAKCAAARVAIQMGKELLRMIAMNVKSKSDQSSAAAGAPSRGQVKTNN
jgi:hypothetical protein